MRLSRSPDLRQLRDEGYEVRVTENGHLILGHVPFVNQQGEIAYGELACSLNIAGDVAEYNTDHVAYFIGGTPCDKAGQPMTANLIHQPEVQQPLEAGLVASVGMSNKPEENFRDYHHKMTWYMGLISAPAESLDPSVTARTHPAIEDDDPDGPFHYIDSASGRARIAAITDRLRLAKVAIVGLGGTGSYVLDLVAKTPIGELHPYDGDDVFTHNAFRSPGAPSLETLRERPKKVEYLAETYSNMKRNIVPHPSHVTADNVDELRGCDFVFLTMEGNQSKRLIVDRLTEFEVPFVDVAIGLNIAQEQLQGAVLTITRTPANHDRADTERHSPAYESVDDGEDIYDLNIQVADLNALNAALAVIRWKKLFGFYGDLDSEHFSAYTIEANEIVNDDLP